MTKQNAKPIILVAAAVTALIGAAAKYGLHAPPTDTTATLLAAGVAIGIAALGLVAATVVPRAGHLLPDQAPQAVVAALDSFTAPGPPRANTRE